MYQPPQKILEKYATVLVNFALNSGQGIKKGEVVRLAVPEPAKPFLIELRKAVLRAEAHSITHFMLDDDEKYTPSRDFYELANEEQLRFFPKKYLKGIINQVDHNISVISSQNPLVLEGINPKKIMTSSKTFKPYMDWLTEKENKGKFTWTVALYGTPQMAKEAGLTPEEYWEQIIRGCFLDYDDPVATWREVSKKNDEIRNKMNSLPIDRLHVTGPDVDLWITLGKKRTWKGGSGRNIPSFEIFTSPDWRGTEGWVKFNQPLYVFDHLVKGVELKFEKGKVTHVAASKNEAILKEMVAVRNADKIGEFSLTDGRFSHITKFMAETLYDENVGGPEGNMHLALGMSYKDVYDGDSSELKRSEWRELGFNNSAIHTDIVSTAPRTVRAYLANGKDKVIYAEGKFTL